MRPWRGAEESAWRGAPPPVGRQVKEITTTRKIHCSIVRISTPGVSHAQTMPPTIRHGLSTATTSASHPGQRRTTQSQFCMSTKRCLYAWGPRETSWCHDCHQSTASGNTGKVERRPKHEHFSHLCPWPGNFVIPAVFTQAVRIPAAHRHLHGGFLSCRRATAGSFYMVSTGAAPAAPS